MDDLNTSTAVEAVAALQARALDPATRVFTSADGREVAILVQGDGSERIVEVTPNGPRTVKPTRIGGTVTVETEQSLADYTRRFKARNSLFLASIASNAIIAVLDYHASSRDEPAGAETSSVTFEPDFLEHRAELHLPFSLEWKAWTGIDGKLLPQLDFVRFLEENREDIRVPDAATVLEACRDLQALRKVDFRSVVREDSDNYRIEYAEESDARTKNDHVTLPTELVLGLPVYFEGDEAEVHALLRWKLDDGKLLLGIKLKRAERIRQAEFRQIVTRVSEDTGVAVVYGRLGG